MTTFSLAEKLGEMLLVRQWRLATAESCTGGGIASAITDIAGSSDWFDRGFVTYSNAAKQSMLGVSESTLREFGAVSEQTVREMVKGALSHSEADLVVAVSGIAGPGGGSVDKPVGLVYTAWGIRGQLPVSRRDIFSGDRQSVRAQAVQQALQGLLAMAMPAD